MANSHSSTKTIEMLNIDDVVSTELLVIQEHVAGFFEQLLTEQRWCSWIRYCILTERFLILVNGNPVGFFTSSRGLRQGVLLPRFSVIVMEALSRMMSAMVDNGYMAGFFIGDTNRGANQNQICSLRPLFLCVEAVSRLKVNLSKLELVLVGNVRHRLANILGCKVYSFPMKYLGLPLGASSRAKSICDEVIEKIEHRLAIWKRLYLSKGGRTTLIKCTLSNFPTHLLSLFPILASVAIQIEKL
ncbi:uncharacterized protein LOC122304731 [Carya illinoinensis]|uniref:uncharacterized protein LOC122304731 n=1 Tax=Carya illinoinensis TaxID=32201 RepID=UPI001C7299AF|nr:uncharacterized protein LOC122304731 [Carya illinoinensis]